MLVFCLNKIFCEDNISRFALDIEDLPKDLKLMLKYRDIDDLTYDEIAKRAKLPIGTVRSRLHRDFN